MGRKRKSEGDDWQIVVSLPSSFPSPLGLPALLTLILIGETERRLGTSQVFISDKYRYTFSKFSLALVCHLYGKKYQNP